MTKLWKLSCLISLRTPVYCRCGSTLQVARNLLGAHLVHETQYGITVGRVVEAEVYLHDDPASHASRGLPERNRIMYGPPGLAYVYLIYGRYCLNCTTNQERVGKLC